MFAPSQRKYQYPHVHIYTHLPARVQHDDQSLMELVYLPEYFFHLPPHQDRGAKTLLTRQKPPLYK